ncbi:hypothetical protein DFJ43DRAFT_249871 [Lentinula guzmanii]|uniref:Uncharacterized protein n=1 Tax=Lentinula guzmanii TaxID=2804957 RepID=A0AA38N5Q6_9AGAR|nr:hypothetical protein DFJ43DRAFT_249871 [Lentinula guzmanii]
MSDEYGGNSFKDSLVDDCELKSQILVLTFTMLMSQAINPEGATINERFKNYPPENDTTSSGGFSTTQEMWSDKAQRGNKFEVKPADEHKPSNGLIDQSLNGSNLKDELQDAKQGKDQ